MPIPSVPSSPSHRPQVPPLTSTGSSTMDVVIPLTGIAVTTDTATEDANKWNNSKPQSLEDAQRIATRAIVQHDNSNNDNRNLHNNIDSNHSSTLPDTENHTIADDAMDTDAYVERLNVAEEEQSNEEGPSSQKYNDPQHLSDQQTQKQTTKRRVVLLHTKNKDEDVVNLSEDRMQSDCVGELYAGSMFKGTQKCGTTSYEVNVEILNVNMKESTLSGYLKIKGLTSEFPELTTFFQAEIIGSKYSFHTRKWQADRQSDLLHWKKFPSFVQSYLENFAKDELWQEEDDQDGDFLYMRWKEMFLVPDHHINAIHGASFAGFYYICYQRSTKHIKGYYFFRHHKDWFQELNLDYVPDAGFSHYEFR